MATYTVQCRQCGKEFPRSVSQRARPPRFCSRQCYQAAGGQAYNKVALKGVRQKRKHVYIGRDEHGKKRYMQRSHVVWNQVHPDDLVQPGEYVHHIDHDPMNDNPANLLKMSVAQHQSYHAYLIPKSEVSRRMKAYHAANPGKHRKGTPNICRVCGKEFYRPPSAPQVTCSSVCSGKWSWIKKRAKEHKDASD